jgi:hypothetical protein
MAYPNDEWQRKGATLSDKTARQEFGLTQDENVPEPDSRGRTATAVGPMAVPRGNNGPDAASTSVRESMCEEMVASPDGRWVPGARI